MLFQEAIGRLKAFDEHVSLKQKQTIAKEDQLLYTYAEWQNKKKDLKEKNKKWGKTEQGQGSQSDFKKKDQEKSKNSRINGKKRVDKSKIKCFKCDNMGHYASDCPGIKVMDQEANLTQEEDKDPALFMIQEEAKKEEVFLNEQSVVPSNYGEEELVWYLDKGASNHMTCNISIFSHLNKKVGGSVKFGDGSCVDIKGRGTIVLEGRNDEQRLLTDVYFIPHLRSNILSLGQATEG